MSKKNLDLVEKFFENKVIPHTYFIITYGPPASGKSTIVDTILNKLGIQELNTIKVLIDDIVEQLPGYQEELKNSIPQLKNKKEKSEKTSEIYFKWRSSEGDLLSDYILSKSISEKYHIIYETTGIKLDWTLKVINQVRKNGYKVILVYPLVNTDELLKRAEKRVEQSKTFPRMPSPEQIKSDAVMAQKNFSKITKYVDASYIYTCNPNSCAIEFFGKEVEYQGFCKLNQTNCKTGIIQKRKCPETTELKGYMDEDFTEFIESECNIKRPKF